MSKRSSPDSGKEEQDSTKKAKMEHIDYDKNNDEESVENILDLLDCTKIDWKQDVDENLQIMKNKFEEIANNVLNNYILKINDTSYRFDEVEFYYQGEGHDDDFTHCDAMQKEGGKWYFHKTGSGYKGGSYKGLDVAFGNPKAFAGMLIRSIEDIETGDVLNGPSLVVDRILKLNNQPAIVDFVAHFDGNLGVQKENGCPGLHLTYAKDQLEQRPIYTSPRVGLTLKKYDLDRPKFIAKPYRFLTNPVEIKKGKPNVKKFLQEYLVAQLVLDGKGADEIAQISGTPKNTVTKYVTFVEDGKKIKPENFFSQSLNAEQTIKMFASCVNNA